MMHLTYPNWSLQGCANNPGLCIENSALFSQSRCWKSNNQSVGFCLLLTKLLLFSFSSETLPKLNQDGSFPGELVGAWTTMFGRLDQASE